MLLIDTKPSIDFSNDTIPQDVPPPYSESNILNSTANATFDDEKELPQAPIALFTTLPSAIGSAVPRNALKSLGNIPQQRTRPSWFARPSRTPSEIRSIVLGLLWDLVKLPHADTCAPILESCAQNCRVHGLSFSTILQEKSIEGHTPIYWAIIKQPTNVGEVEENNLITSLLTLSDPLTPSTTLDIRMACLYASNEILFQRLRQSPVFSPVLRTDELLLGTNIPPDEIIVEDVPNDEYAFSVQLHIAMFQKRMWVSKQINTEFIARGRMWSLTFLNVTGEEGDNGVKPGSWIVTLSLLAYSPLTWLDSRLIIPEPKSLPLHPLLNTSTPTSTKPKPAICLRLKTESSMLTPSAIPSPSMSHKIIKSFDDSLMANSLLCAGSKYINDDGSLHAKWEARLGKPSMDCVIC